MTEHILYLAWIANTPGWECYKKKAACSTWDCIDHEPSCGPLMDWKNVENGRFLWKPIKLESVWFCRFSETNRFDFEFLKNVK
jgi:hypothetical protein